MNASPRFRYYLALVLLLLLGLAIGVRNGADVIERSAAGLPAPAEAPARLLARH